MKLIYCCFFTTLIIISFSTIDITLAEITEVPTNYYYCCVQENTDGSKNFSEKILNSSSTSSDFDNVLKWQSYSGLVIKYYTASGEYSAFPSYLDWNSYLNNMGTDLSVWTYYPSPVSLWADTDDSYDENNSIIIWFYSGWGSAFKHILGYTYKAVINDGFEYYLDYKTDDPIEGCTYTYIYLNSSDSWHTQVIENPANASESDSIKWSLSDNPSYNNVDVLSVVRHELGHAFGLAHPNSTDSEWNDSIMRSPYVLGTQNEVTNIDQLALKYLNDRYIPTPSNGIKKTIPSNFSIISNYPNPFNPNTTIKYKLPERTRIEIDIYNTLGQKVRTLFKGINQEGTHQIEWDGQNDFKDFVSSGVYFIVIRSENIVKSKKLLLLR